MPPLGVSNLLHKINCRGSDHCGKHFYAVNIKLAKIFYRVILINSIETL